MIRSFPVILRLFFTVMKWLILITAAFFFVSCNRDSRSGDVKVAGVNQAVTADVLTRADSLKLLEQEAFTVWLTQTYYALKHSGLSNKKAWLYIDSATRTKYNDSIPSWYPQLRQESDSLIREKNKYKRKRIV